MDFFLSAISLGQYYRKSLAKSMGFGKYIKRGIVNTGGFSIKVGLKPSSNYNL